MDRENPSPIAVNRNPTNPHPFLPCFLAAVGDCINDDQRINVGVEIPAYRRITLDAVVDIVEDERPRLRLREDVE